MRSIPYRFHIEATTSVWSVAAGRYPSVFNAPTPVSSERGGTDDLLSQTLWSYHWGSDQPALATSPVAHTVQDCRDDVQSYTRQRAVKPGNTRICRLTWSASSLLWGAGTGTGNQVVDRHLKQNTVLRLLLHLSSLEYTTCSLPYIFVPFSPFLFINFERSFVDTSASFAVWIHRIIFLLDGHLDGLEFLAFHSLGLICCHNGFLLYYVPSYISSTE